MGTSRWLDVAFAALIAVGGLTEVATDPGTFNEPAAAAISVLLGAAAMLLRSRWPVACLGSFLALVALPYVLGAAAQTMTASTVLGSLIALGSVGQRSRERTAVAALVVTTTMYAGGALLSARPYDAVAGLLGCGTAWGVGQLLRREKERNADLRSLAAELAAEREARAREAVSAERTRIAGELHDAVAHTVSVMTIQAGAVRRRLDVEPERARERDVLLHVERLGREAVEELHRAVGILRTPAAEGAATLVPQPRLSDIEQLAARVSDAGVPVEVSVTGAPRPLPPGLELAAYRVVQEALTNTLKHAGPARACVDITYTGDAVRVEVADNGRAVPTAASNGRRGHGLEGMRERVAMYGGEVEAGPVATGGYVVRATLPVSGGPAEPGKPGT